MKMKNLFSLAVIGTIIATAPAFADTIGQSSNTNLTANVIDYGIVVVNNTSGATQDLTISNSDSTALQNSGFAASTLATPITATFYVGSNNNTLFGVDITATAANTAATNALYNDGDSTTTKCIVFAKDGSSTTTVANAASATASEARNSAEAIAFSMTVSGYKGDLDSANGNAPSTTDAFAPGEKNYNGVGSKITVKNLQQGVNSITLSVDSVKTGSIAWDDTTGDYKATVTLTTVTNPA